MKESDFKIKNKKEFDKLLEDNLNWKFWHSYYTADLLERNKILEPVIKRVKELITLKDFSEKGLTDSLNLILKSYFDDLIEYMQLKEGDFD